MSTSDETTNSSGPDARGAGVAAVQRAAAVEEALIEFEGFELRLGLPTSAGEMLLRQDDADGVRSAA